MSRGQQGVGSKRVLHFVMTAALVATLVLLGACKGMSRTSTSATAPSTAAPPDVFASAQLAPFKLSCGACMIRDPEGCSRLGQLPLVAVVAGMNGVTGFKKCARSEHSGDSQPCWVHRASKFDQVTFVTNRASASSADVFFSLYQFDLTITEARSGVFLEQDRSYLIFGGRPDVPTDPAADWYIVAACEIPPPRTQH